MYKIKKYKITDTMTGVTYSSAKQIWRVYNPGIPYSTFVYRLTHNMYSNLLYEPYGDTVTDNDVIAKGEGSIVRSLTNGRMWYSISECARSLGVSHQAVLNSIKRKRLCRGHELVIFKKGKPQG
jgi:hypothetical protein